MFGSFGGATAATSITFISQAAFAAGLPQRLGLKKMAAAVRSCRSIGKMCIRDRSDRAVRGKTGTRRFAGVSCGVERDEVAIVWARGGDAAEGELISLGFPRSMRFGRTEIDARGLHCT